MGTILIVSYVNEAVEAVGSLGGYPVKLRTEGSVGAWITIQDEKRLREEAMRLLMESVTSRIEIKKGRVV